MLAATPIGSHTHASPALREALASADVIAAKDTRRLATLLRRIDVITTAHECNIIVNCSSCYF